MVKNGLKIDPDLNPGNVHAEGGVMDTDNEYALTSTNMLRGFIFPVE